MRLLNLRQTKPVPHIYLEAMPTLSTLIYQESSIESSLHCKFVIEVKLNQMATYSTFKDDQMIQVKKFRKCITKITQERVWEKLYEENAYCGNGSTVLNLMFNNETTSDTQQDFSN